jgi:hypothetical protein
MNTITRRDQSRGLTLQDEVNRLFEDNFTRERSGHAELATWAPLVDIFETENELVVKADLPDLQDKDIDVRITNNAPNDFSTTHSQHILLIYKSKWISSHSSSLPKLRTSTTPSPPMRTMVVAPPMVTARLLKC